MVEQLGLFGESVKQAVITVTPLNSTPSAKWQSFRPSAGRRHCEDCVQTIHEWWMSGNTPSHHVRAASMRRTVDGIGDNVYCQEHGEARKKADIESGATPKPRGAK